MLETTHLRGRPMPVIKITQQVLPALVPSPGKSIVYWDTEIAGFGVKVTPGGARSFIVQARIQIGVNKRRVRLNSCERMSVKEARIEARKQLASMGLGIDPISARKEVELASMSLRAALEDRIKAKGLKERVARDYRNIATQAFSDWLDRPIAAISPQMAVDRHRAITDRSGPSYANYAMRVLSSSFNYARGQHGLKTANPVSRLREGKLFNRTRARDEFVEPHELPQLLLMLRRLEFARVHSKTARKDLRNPETCQSGVVEDDGEKRLGAPSRGYEGAADIVRLLLLTGFRLEEAQGLEWTSVNLEQKTITLTSNKASRTLRMPMCSALVRLLSRRAKQVGGSRWVFPTAGEGRYQNLSSRDMPILSKVVSNELRKPFHVHAHKLRHTFATYLRAMNHSEWVVAALLNHSRQSSVTTLYAAPMTATMHNVVNEYQAYLESLLEQAGASPEHARALLSGCL